MAYRPGDIDNWIEDMRLHKDTVAEAAAHARAAPPLWLELPPHRRLWRLRMRAGLTQKELAHRCGMHQTQIARIEDGSDARWSTLCRLFRALGYEPLLLPLGPPA